MYVGMIAWGASDPHRGERWRRNTWDKLAFVARYGHVPPQQAASLDRHDLDDLCQALNEIIKEENKRPAK